MALFKNFEALWSSICHVQTSNWPNIHFNTEKNVFQKSQKSLFQGPKNEQNAAVCHVMTFTEKIMLVHVQVPGKK